MMPLLFCNAPHTVSGVWGIRISSRGPIPECRLARMPSDTCGTTFHLMWNLYHIPLPRSATPRNETFPNFANTEAASIRPNPDGVCSTPRPASAATNTLPIVSDLPKETYPSAYCSPTRKKAEAPFPLAKYPFTEGAISPSKTAFWFSMVPADTETASTTNRIVMKVLIV